MSTLSRPLTERTALVIGGSGGIGFAIVSALAKAGARIAIAARNAERVNCAVDAVAALDVDVSGHVCDVCDPSTARKLITEVAASGAGLDVLVNCQGTTVIKPAIEVTPAEYDRVMSTNLRSLFFACLAAHPVMRAAGGGSIINIASLAAHRGWPKAAVYAMSKHGVLALTRSLASEWAADGIRVNSISPGFFMTDLNRERMGEARKASALERTPLGRFGEVEELGATALYLASDAASFVTGADFVVDGGYLAQGI